MTQPSISEIIQQQGGCLFDVHLVSLFQAFAHLSNRFEHGGLFPGFFYPIHVRQRFRVLFPDKGNKIKRKFRPLSKFIFDGADKGQSQTNALILEFRPQDSRRIKEFHLLI